MLDLRDYDACLPGKQRAGRKDAALKSRKVKWDKAISLFGARALKRDIALLIKIYLIILT